MNIINKMISFIKRLFNKKELKQLEAPRDIKTIDDKKEKFMNSIKVVTELKKKKKTKIETLICPGDGLGIQQGIKY